MEQDKLPIIGFLIPTNEPSDLVLGKISNELELLEKPVTEGQLIKPQHIYITSKRDIKEGDWIERLKKAYKVKKFSFQRGYRIAECSDGLICEASKIDWGFKIEFTTDPKLIADGVPVIDGNTKAYVKGFGIPYMRKGMELGMSDNFVEVNFLSEFVKRYNNRKIGFEERFAKSEIFKLKDDNQKGVDVGKLIEMLNDMDSMVMSLEDVLHGNEGKQATSIRHGIIEIKNEVRKSNDEKFSLEDIDLFLKWADKKYLFNEDGKWENKIDFGGVFYTTTPELLKEFQSLTEEATGAELEWMKENPPFGGPYPPMKPKGLEMYVEMESNYQKTEDDGEEYGFPIGKRIKPINAQAVIHFKA